MKVYEKNERQRKASLGQQPRNAKRDQDLEMLVGLKRRENGAMIRQENGAMILTLQHILLLHVGTRNKIKT